MGTGRFDLEDFLQQMRQMRKMGPMAQLLDMIPGMGKALNDPQVKEALEGDQMKQTEAIILSMTLRRAPQPRHPQWQPQTPDREGQRHDTPGDQSVARVLQAGADDDEADDGDAAGRQRWQARVAEGDLAAWVVASAVWVGLAHSGSRAINP